MIGTDSPVTLTLRNWGRGFFTKAGAWVGLVTESADINGGGGGYFCVCVFFLQKTIKTLLISMHSEFGYFALGH